MPQNLRPRIQPDAQETEAEHAHRMTVNLVAAIVCLLLLGAGLFIVEALDRAARAESCVEAGRRVCNIPGVRR